MQFYPDLSIKSCCIRLMWSIWVGLNQVQDHLCELNNRTVVYLKRVVSDWLRVNFVALHHWCETWSSDKHKCFLSVFSLISASCFLSYLLLTADCIITNLWINKLLSVCCLAMQSYVLSARVCRYDPQIKASMKIISQCHNLLGWLELNKFNFCLVFTQCPQCLDVNICP